MAFSIIIVTKGRDSLKRVLLDLAKEIKKVDEVFVVFDGVDIPNNLPQRDNIKYIKEDFVGNWGHKHKEKYSKLVSKDFFMYMDDDDYYKNGWREEVEQLIENKNSDAFAFNVIDCGVTHKNSTISGNIITRNTEYNRNLHWPEDYLGDIKRAKELNNIQFIDYTLLSIKIPFGKAYF